MPTKKIKAYIGTEEVGVITPLTVFGLSGSELRQAADAADCLVEMLQRELNKRNRDNLKRANQSKREAIAKATANA